jgi:hypothetical protein
LDLGFDYCRHSKQHAKGCRGRKKIVILAPSWRFFGVGGFDTILTAKVLAGR